MKKTTAFLLASLFIFFARAATGAGYPPLDLEGVQISVDDGPEFLMGLFERAYGGRVPFESVRMEPEVFGVFGEILAPRKLVPGVSSATFRVKTGSGRIQAVTVRLDWRAPMVAARREIARGEVISADALDLRVDSYKRTDGTVFADPKALIGKRATRRIPAGAPVSRRDVETVFLVGRRDPVTVLSKSGNVTASLEGVALQEGDEGDFIEVRIPRYRNDCLAVVVDKGVVELVGPR
ncbi:MAG: Flagella basal body P-ring formation protein FlgA [Synergistales bacterium 53_16]|jgi:flagella basal body P-ring formation protein FlgA|nr:MAG: Flagella basal body P-ring formation protein FlgA [Synergistales bacterium 53_16]MDK2846029.1 flagellar basal body P-ring formation protein FlgA [Synergistales bacterium]MDN5335054.1 flagellar basal body P-ring formation protein FlgA [Synergistales bacterium]